LETSLGYIDFDSKKPGVHAIDNFYSNKFDYLLRHKNFKWANITWVHGQSLPLNVVRFKGNYAMVSGMVSGIGRFNESGFVEIKPISYPDENVKQAYKNNTVFEMLVC
jgi:hypothetical protein